MLGTRGSFLTSPCGERKQEAFSLGALLKEEWLEEKTGLYRWGTPEGRGKWAHSCAPPHPMDLCGCLNLKVLKSLSWNSVLASYPRMSFILRSLSLGDLQFPSVCMLFREQ